MRKISFLAMGSQIHAFIDDDGVQAAWALEKVPGWFEAWEQSLSRFRPNSELSQVNAAGGAEVTVSPTFWEVLSISLQEAYWSGGLVVPDLLPALEDAGYDQSFDTLLASNNAREDTKIQVRETHAPFWHAWTQISTDPQSMAIRLPAGMRMDFGGIAKGWAAWQAMQALQPYGPVLVDAGGDIAVSGFRARGLPWQIDVADPLTPDACLETLAIDSGGVATSGIDYRRWLKDGVWKHHIIDPRTGAPADTDLMTVTVIAPDTVQAETAAKVVLILGSRAGLEWLENQPGLSALLALQDGQIMRSSRLAKYYWRS
jgi:FAD:protein FMN transferase